MEKITFQINGKVEFIFEEGDIGVSLIQGLYEEDILITIPMRGVDIKILHIGDELDGFYYHDNNVYMFSTVVLDRMIENIPLYKIKKPDYLKRVQRRNFVRIPISMPIIYTKFDEKLADTKDKNLQEIEKEYKELWRKGFTKDLSGGGTSISTDKPLKTGTLLYMIFKNEKLNIGMKGRVVRCVPYVFNKTFAYNLGIEFKDISESKRDRVIKFIFQLFRKRKNLDL